MQFENLSESVDELDQLLRELNRQYEIAKEQLAQIQCHNYNKLVKKIILRRTFSASDI